MNYGMVFNTTGKVVKIEAIMFVFPICVALIFAEWFNALAFAIAAAIALAVGFCFTIFKPRNQLIFAKEGLVTVALAWIFVSLIGALPFVIGGVIPSYVDAIFETVSGFTTTGATIINDVEVIGKSMQFWRSLTHFVGGMGVLVFVMAVTSKATDRSIHILRAEMPGPIVDKLVPRAKDTALILYLIYIGLTLLLAILLLFGGMDLFESIVHAMATAGTGGFGIKNDSFASYSNYVQWVVSVFMILYGVNFNVFYLIILGKIGSAMKSEEFWVYILTVIASIAIVCVSLISVLNYAFPDALRYAAFQVAAFMSTTGFTTANYNAWPDIAKAVLLALMFVGGCAGSTAGGIKITRLVILVKKLGNDLKHTLHPRTASIVKFEGKRVDESTLESVSGYLVIYLIILVSTVLLLSLDPSGFGFEANFTASVSCFNNIGPFFSASGMGNFSDFSVFSKIVLTFSMLLGRLEIYPMLLTLAPSTWIKK
jgi:trk system potassium uptake protein TrkH